MSRITASERLQRLLALIPWVAAHDGPTVREVCERFDLKERELLADISLVSLVGVPPYTPDELFDVVVEDGRVWVHLSPTFRRALRLTPEQALALVAAGRSLRAVPGADPEGPLARGLAKLAATLGVDPDEVVDVDLGIAAASVLTTVRDASAAHQRIRLDYYSHGRDERTTREVDPYRVYADRGQWYVVGFDHLRGEERLFRVDRIVDVEILDERFEPPTETRTHGLYEPDPSDRRVCLELAPDAAWVAEAYPVETLEPLGDGRLRVTLAISALPWLERLLVRLGPNATLVDPVDDDVAALRANAARRMLRRYSGAVPSPAP
jgi:proteasome accessory factor C